VIYLLDVNVVVGLLRQDSHWHAPATQFWRDEINAGDRVALTPEICASVVRICSNPKIWKSDFDVTVAAQAVEDFISHPSVVLATHPQESISVVLHYIKLMSLTSADIPDALIAATSWVLKYPLVSADRGFTRYPDIALTLLASEK
jgi:predicted nucleic acid-binding protein